MKSSDYLRVIRKHPNCASVLYLGVEAQGIYEETGVEIFQDAIKRIVNRELTVVTEYFPMINKKTNPTININGKDQVIQDHYQENKFLTKVILQ